MEKEKTDIPGMGEAALTKALARAYGKGRYHAQGVIETLYSTGSLETLACSPRFTDNPELAEKIRADFLCALPPARRVSEEAGTKKFTLSLHDGMEIESVIIPMKAHTTLCVSSQVGCARACTFCRTARMGFVRNLTTAEIVAQYLTARFTFGADIRNIVFMGMGEPLDNLGAVLEAVDILTDPHGAAILARRISISTCAPPGGLEQFAERIKDEPEKGYRLVTLGVSLHAANDETRSALMPVNRLNPLGAVRRSLTALPHASDKDKIYFEYMVIPSVNDSEDDAQALRDFIAGFRAKVNLIAFNPPEGSPLPGVTDEDVDRFWKRLRAHDLACYSRSGKGSAIQASCGQLATRIPR
jgi:23S rRNA (adenine2503-C2)-methyltransferase